MQRIVSAALLLALLVTAASCVQEPKTKPIMPDQQEQWTPAPMPNLYESVLGDLLPDMEAEDLGQRERAQRDFEAFCLRMGKPGLEKACSVFCTAITKRLGPETPKPARVWLIRQLERIGGEESVVRLTELLNDDDPQIRELSRRALQHNPTPPAVEALRAALKAATEPTRQVALVNALGTRRDQTSIPRLAKLARGSNADVASAAIAALGNIGADAKIIAALHAIRRNENRTRQDQAAAALLRCGEHLLDSGARGRAAKIFEDLYRSSPPFPIRVAALRGLALAKQEGALPRLFALMRGDDPQMRDLAARFALEIPGEVITRTLAAVLPHLPPPAQAVLLDGLGERGDPAARSAALGAVKSSEEHVRVAALHALRHLGDSSTAILLARVAAQSASRQREVARESLNLLRGEDVDETILAAMQEQTEPALRCELISSLAARWYRPAVPALFAASRVHDETIQAAAFKALGSLAGEVDLPALVGRLADLEGDDARQAAENAVVETAARIDDPEQRTEPLLAVLDQTAAAVRASLIRVLGRIGGARALEAIRAEWPGSDPDVVDAAVRALADWPDPEVTDDLLDIVRTGPDQTHRVLALRGYVRLVRLPSEREPIETFKMLEEALGLAARPEDKKLVLGGLAEVRHIDALMLAELQLGDEALRDEAAVSMLTIARALAAEQRGVAMAAIEKVRAARTSGKIRQQADETAEFIARFDGYGAAWLICGPYVQEGQKPADLFDTAFPPESPAAPDVVWTSLPVNNHANPWIFDLAKAVGGVSRCAYVRTAVWSDEEQPVTLEIGSDDAVKAWLNGQLVHSNLAYRGVTPGEDKITVTLNEGRNTLMLKIVQGGGAWGFCAGFKTPEGGAPAGLEFHAD